MKFNCGPTAQELRERECQRYFRMREWHIWYAWHPVRVGSGDCRWLEPVQRRRIYDEWQYRLPGATDDAA